MLQASVFIISSVIVVVGIVVVIIAADIFTVLFITIVTIFCHLKDNGLRQLNDPYTVQGFIGVLTLAVDLVGLTLVDGPMEAW